MCESVERQETTTWNSVQTFCELHKCPASILLTEKLDPLSQVCCCYERNTVRQIELTGHNTTIYILLLCLVLLFVIVIAFCCLRKVCKDKCCRKPEMLSVHIVYDDDVVEL